MWKRLHQVLSGVRVLAVDDSLHMPGMDGFTLVEQIRRSA
jgi:hypothetical protein